MADIVVKVTADTSKAKAEMKQLRQELTKMGSVNIINEQGFSKQLMESTQMARELNQALSVSFNDALGKLDLSKFNQQLMQSGRTLTDYQNSLSQFGTQGRQAFSQLTQSIVQAEIPTKKMSGMIGDMWTTLGNTVKWQMASGVVHGMMSEVSKVVQFSEKLDKSLNNIRIVTGDSTEHMRQFATEANKTAKSLSTTTTKYTDASLIYYQQGLSEKAVKERTAVTMKLANVTGMSAKQASQDLTAIWNNFDNGSKSLEHYADVLTKLGSETASSSEEIATGIEKFASVSKTVGLSYEYATAALATVTAKTRESADTVGTAFRTLFSRLQGLKLGETLEDGTTVNKYSKALEVVGVKLKDTKGEMRDMDDILMDLSAKWKTLGKDQQIALAQTVGGARQYSTFMALMNNSDYFKENIAKAQNADGTLQKQQDIYAESWEAANARVKASAEGIYKSLFDSEGFINFQNSMAGTLDIINGMVKGLGGLSGVLTAVGAIGGRIFSKQIGQGLTNFGQSIMSMTPAGRNRLAALQREAIDKQIKATSATHGPNAAAEAKMLQSYGNAQQAYLAKSVTLNTTQKANLQKSFDIVNDINKNFSDAIAQQTEAAALQQSSLSNFSEGTFFNSGSAPKGVKDRFEFTEGINNSKIMASRTSGLYLTGSSTDKNAGNQLMGGILQRYGGTPDSMGQYTEAQKIQAMAKYLGATVNGDGTISAIRGFDSKKDQGAFLAKLVKGLEQGDLDKDAETELKSMAGMYTGEKNKALDQLSPEAKAVVDKTSNDVRDADNRSIRTGGDVNNSAAQLLKMVGETKPSIEVGQAIASVGSAALGAVVGVQGLANSMKVLNDVNATASDTTGAIFGMITSLTTGLVSMIPVITQFNTTIGASSVTMGGLGLAVAGIIGAIALFSWAFAQVETDAKKLKSAQNAEAALTAQSNDLKNSAQELKSAFEGYSDLTTELSNCARYSEDWYNALDKVSNSAAQLLEKYPELAQMANLFNYDAASGTYILNSDAVQGYQQKVSERASIGQAAALLGNQYRLELDQPKTEEQVQSALKSALNGTVDDTNNAFYFSKMESQQDLLSNTYQKASVLFNDSNTTLSHSKLYPEFINNLLSALQTEYDNNEETYGSGNGLIANKSVVAQIIGQQMQEAVDVNQMQFSGFGLKQAILTANANGFDDTSTNEIFKLLGQYVIRNHTGGDVNVKDENYESTLDESLNGLYSLKNLGELANAIVNNNGYNYTGTKEDLVAGWTRVFYDSASQDFYDRFITPNLTTLGSFIAVDSKTRDTAISTAKLVFSDALNRQDINASDELISFMASQFIQTYGQQMSDSIKGINFDNFIEWGTKYANILGNGYQVQELTKENGTSKIKFTDGNGNDVSLDLATVVATVLSSEALGTSNLQSKVLDYENQVSQSKQNIQSSPYSRGIQSDEAVSQDLIGWFYQTKKSLGSNMTYKQAKWLSVLGDNVDSPQEGISDGAKNQIAQLFGFKDFASGRSTIEAQYGSVEKFFELFNAAAENNFGPNGPFISNLNKGLSDIITTVDANGNRVIQNDYRELTGQQITGLNTVFNQAGQIQGLEYDFQAEMQNFLPSLAGKGQLNSFIDLMTGTDFTNSALTPLIKNILDGLNGQLEENSQINVDSFINAMAQIQNSINGIDVTGFANQIEFLQSLLTGNQTGKTISGKTLTDNNMTQEQLTNVGVADTDGSMIVTGSAHEVREATLTMINDEIANAAKILSWEKDKVFSEGLKSRGQTTRSGFMGGGLFENIPASPIGAIYDEEFYNNWLDLMKLALQTSANKTIEEGTTREQIVADFFASVDSDGTPLVDTYPFYAPLKEIYEAQSKSYTYGDLYDNFKLDTVLPILAQIYGDDFASGREIDISNRDKINNSTKYKSEDIEAVNAFLNFIESSGLDFNNGLVFDSSVTGAIWERVTSMCTGYIGYGLESINDQLYSVGLKTIGKGQILKYFGYNSNDLSKGNYDVGRRMLGMDQAAWSALGNNSIDWEKIALIGAMNELEANGISSEIYTQLDNWDTAQRYISSLSGRRLGENSSRSDRYDALAQWSTKLINTFPSLSTDDIGNIISQTMNRIDLEGGNRAWSAVAQDIVQDMIAFKKAGITSDQYESFVSNLTAGENNYFNQMSNSQLNYDPLFRNKILDTMGNNKNSDLFTLDQLAQGIGIFGNSSDGTKDYSDAVSDYAAKVISAFNSGAKYGLGADKVNSILDSIVSSYFGMDYSSGERKPTSAPQGGLKLNPQQGKSSFAQISSLYASLLPLEAKLMAAGVDSSFLYDTSHGSVLGKYLIDQINTDAKEINQADLIKAAEKITDAQILAHAFGVDFNSVYQNTLDKRPTTEQGQDWDFSSAFEEVVTQAVVENETGLSAKSLFGDILNSDTATNFLSDTGFTTEVIKRVFNAHRNSQGLVQADDLIKLAAQIYNSDQIIGSSQRDRSDSDTYEATGEKDEYLAALQWANEWETAANDIGEGKYSGLQIWEWANKTGSSLMLLKDSVDENVTTFNELSENNQLEFGKNIGQLYAEASKQGLSEDALTGIITAAVTINNTSLLKSLGLVNDDGTSLSTTSSNLSAEGQKLLQRAQNWETLGLNPGAVLTNAEIAARKNFIASESQGEHRQISLNKDVVFGTDKELDAAIQEAVASENYQNEIARQMQIANALGISWESLRDQTMANATLMGWSLENEAAITSAMQSESEILRNDAGFQADQSSRQQIQSILLTENRELIDDWRKQYGDSFSGALSLIGQIIFDIAKELMLDAGSLAQDAETLANTNRELYEAVETQAKVQTRSASGEPLFMATKDGEQIMVYYNSKDGKYHGIDDEVVDEITDDDIQKDEAGQPVAATDPYSLNSKADFASKLGIIKAYAQEVNADWNTVLSTMNYAYENSASFAAAISEELDKAGKGIADIVAKATEYDLDPQQIIDLMDYIASRDDWNEKLENATGDELVNLVSQLEEVALAIALVDSAIENIKKNSSGWADDIAAGGAKANNAYKAIAKELTKYTKATTNVTNSTAKLIQKEGLLAKAADGTQQSYAEVSKAIGLTEFYQSGLQKQITDNTTYADIENEVMDSLGQAYEKMGQSAESAAADMQALADFNANNEAGTIFDAETMEAYQRAFEGMMQACMDQGMSAQDALTATGNAMSEIVGNNPTPQLKTVSASSFGSQEAQGVAVVPNPDGKTYDLIDGNTVTTTMSGEEEITYIDWSGAGVGTSGGGSSTNGNQSGGGGGGGGGGKPRKKASTDHRYHTITKRQDLNKKKSDAQSKASERAFGAAKLESMEKEVSLMKEAKKLQEDRLAEARSYIEGDKKDLLSYMETAMPGIELTFDENGNLTNATEILGEINERLADAAASQDEQGSTDLSNAKQALEDYEKTIEELQDGLQGIIDLENEIYDKQLEILKTGVEINIAVDDDTLGYLDYLLKNLKDDAYDAAEAIALLGQQTVTNLSKVNEWKRGLGELLSKHQVTDEDTAKLQDPNTTEAEKAEILKKYNFTQGEIDQIREWRDSILDAMSTLQEMRENVLEKVDAAFTKLSEDVQEQIDLFEHYGSLLETIRSIRDLMNFKLDPETKKSLQSLNQIAMMNSQNKIESNRDYLQQLMAVRAQYQSEYDKVTDESARRAWAEKLKTIDEEIRNANENFMSSWQEALELAGQILEEEANLAAEAFESAMSPLYQSLDYLVDAFDRAQTTSQQYLQDYDRLYELSKLNRDIAASIDDTETMAGKKKLIELQTEINRLQENGTKLSEYDVEFLRKKYELELARQNLLDAQEEKSLVRLSRDNNGNWGYVYTADQDAVDNAEQEYEDKLHEMHVLSGDYINSIQEEIVSLQQSTKDALLEIFSDTSLSEEQKIARSQELLNNYQAQLTFFTSQLQGALENQEWTYDRTLTTYKVGNANLVDSFKETNLSILTGFGNLNDYLSTSLSSMDTFLQSLLTSTNNFSTAVNSINTAAGSTNFVATLQSGISDIGSASNTASQAVTALGTAMTTTFAQVIAQAGNWEREYATHIQQAVTENNAFVESINRMIEALSRLSNYNQNTAVADTTWEAFLQLVASIPASIGITPTPPGGANANAPAAFDTGGYTGDWGSSGKIALLHQKELVLNARDTENMLNIIELVRQLDVNAKTFESYMVNSYANANGIHVKTEPMNQEVTIHAEFPNAVYHNEIEEAFNNIINEASQYAFRKNNIY